MTDPLPPLEVGNKLLLLFPWSPAFWRGFLNFPPLFEAMHPVFFGSAIPSWTPFLNFGLCWWGSLEYRQHLEPLQLAGPPSPTLKGVDFSAQHEDRELFTWSFSPTVRIHVLKTYFSWGEWSLQMLGCFSCVPYSFLDSFNLQPWTDFDRTAILQKFHCGPKSCPFQDYFSGNESKMVV